MIKDTDITVNFSLTLTVEEVQEFLKSYLVSKKSGIRFNADRFTANSVDRFTAKKSTTIPFNHCRTWVQTDKKTINQFLKMYRNHKGKLPRGKMLELASILGRTVRATTNIIQRNPLWFPKLMKS